LRDEDLEDSLKSTIFELLNDPKRLQKMRASMRALSTPTAAEKIAEIILKSSAQNKQKGVTA
jgi:UDP-N-acetylglucosamine:LPS N-acetylglucosamine transferase